MTVKTNAAPSAKGTASKEVSFGSLTAPTIRQAGCPCGCTSRPGFDDPACVRHRPIREPEQREPYDATVLGLTWHPRDLCAACLAVGR